MWNTLKIFTETFKILLLLYVFLAVEAYGILAP